MENIKTINNEVKINYEVLAAAIVETFFGSIDNGKTYYNKEDVKALFEKMCNIDEEEAKKEDEASRKERETAIKVISLIYSVEGLMPLEKVGEELDLPSNRVKQIAAKTLRQMGGKLKLQAS